LARFSKDLFVDATKRRWLTGFWMERGWIGNMRDLAQAKRECVSDFFSEWGDFGCRGVCRFSDVRWVSGIVGRPNVNANAFLVYSGDLKFGVGDEGVKGLVPPDKEPGVVDEFKG
jgi:hypothetical protein